MLGLLPIAILVAIVYAVVRLITGRTNPVTGENSEGDLRELVARMFRLGLLAAAVSLSAEGVAALIGQILPRAGDELARDPLEIAQALSFTIVGVPSVLGLVWWTRRRMEADPDEEPSIIWAAYLGGMLIVALATAMFASIQVLRWIFGLDDFDGRTLGRAVSWSAVLAVHWVLNRRRPLLDLARRPEDRTPVYLLAGSVIGLATAAFGVWQVLRALIQPLFDEVFGGVIADEFSNLIRRALVNALVGLVVWIWFWLLAARTSPRTQRWYAYVLLIGVLSGLTTTISAAGVVIHSILQWYVGNPSSTTAAAHFDPLAGAVAAALVGIGLWVHHRLTLEEPMLPAEETSDQEPTAHRPEWNEVDRIYHYLVAFAGLVVSAVAMALILAAVFEAIAQPDLVGRAVANPVVTAATFAIIGGPLWWLFWRRMERRVAAAPVEVLSPSRRVYVIGAVGISAAAALTSLVITLTIVFEDVAGAEFGSETLFRLRVPLGVLIAAAAVVAYHAVVYRDDRALAPAPVPDEAAPEPPAPPTRPHLMVVTDLPTDARNDVLAALGFGNGDVTAMTVPGPGSPPTDSDLAEARDELAAVSSPGALVIVRSGQVEVQPLIDDDGAGTVDERS